MASTLERVGGMLTLLVGGTSLAYAVFRPSYTDGQGNWRSIAEESLNPGSVTFLLLMLVAMGVVTVGAARHGRGGGRRWFALIVAGTLALLLGTLLSLLSIGLLLVPALVLALVTLGSGLARTSHEPGGAAA
ncbi:MAG: hypothetical protein IT340_04170 [Chloroflexi bacterium]|nr:hypothetical protein [Chloroflexota bacterium]